MIPVIFLIGGRECVAIRREIDAGRMTAKDLGDPRCFHAFEIREKQTSSVRVEVYVGTSQGMVVGADVYAWLLRYTTFRRS